MYCDYGGDPGRLRRLMLAGWHWMATATTGNTWEFRGAVMREMLRAVTGLNSVPMTTPLDESRLDKAIELGIRAEWIEMRSAAVPATEVLLAERAKADAERRLSEHIARIRAHRPVWPDLEPEPNGITPHQCEKVAAFRHSALGILAGTPGTGKTFTAAVLLRKMLKQFPAGRIAVCAPTGKAAVRITSAMKRYDLPIEATTIHRLLGVAGYHDGRFKFVHNETNPIDEFIVVVDETSMLDTELAASLFAAVPPGGNVLCVGDPGQLSPVGHGAPFRDMIDGGSVPFGLLDEIKRNSGRIVVACKQIRDGKGFAASPHGSSWKTGENLKIFDAVDAAQQRDNIIAILRGIREKGEFNPILDVQVLVATNDKTEVSRKQLNDALQNELNPIDSATATDPAARNPKYRVGDKIICLSNTEMTAWELRGCPMDGTDTADMSSWIQSTAADSGVYLANGDMGRVEATAPDAIIATFTMPTRTVKIKTRKKKADGDERGDDDYRDFDLAYAITVHKSQGSEWPVVVVVLDDSAKLLTSREWIYTAISRAASLCVMVGKMPTALKMARQSRLNERRTQLKELIAAS